MQTKAAVLLRRGVVGDPRTDCNGLAEYERIYNSVCDGGSRDLPPPLNGLRSVEALARHESFARAVREELLRMTDYPDGYKIEPLEPL